MSLLPGTPRQLPGARRPPVPAEQLPDQLREPRSWCDAPWGGHPSPCNRCQMVPKCLGASQYWLKEFVCLWGFVSYSRVVPLKSLSDFFANFICENRGDQVSCYTHHPHPHMKHSKSFLKYMHKCNNTVKRTHPYPNSATVFQNTTFLTKLQ